MFVTYEMTCVITVDTSLYTIYLGLLSYEEKCRDLLVAAVRFGKYSCVSMASLCGNGIIKFIDATQ